MLKPMLNVMVACSQSVTYSIFMIEAALAVIPAAMRKKIRTFSKTGRRSWYRKVSGYNEKMTSVAMLTKPPQLDTMRKIRGPVHFAPVIDGSQTAASGRHCTRGKRNSMTPFEMTIATVNLSKSRHTRFWTKLLRVSATLSFTHNMQAAQRTALKIPNLTTRCVTGPEANEMEESVHHTMA